MIFSGTLRYNLDPFKEYNDESIYNALVTVENKAALIKGIGTNLMWTFSFTHFKFCRLSQGYNE